MLYNEPITYFLIYYTRGENMALKVIIDSGHGGSDPGASGNNIIEKSMTLDISKAMYD